MQRVFCDVKAHSVMGYEPRDEIIFNYFISNKNIWGQTKTTEHPKRYLEKNVRKAKNDWR